LFVELCKHQIEKQPNETVEKPLVRKMFKKNSHNRLKNSQNIVKMLCGTPKNRRFSVFLSHFSKIIFERRLFRQFQRIALPALGRGRRSRPARKMFAADWASGRQANIAQPKRVSAGHPQRQVHAVLGAVVF
jgi:hypothetical protein